MKRILGRKQRIDNQLWLDAMNQIEDLVSADELEEAVRKVREDIREKTAGKKVAYCWSGGKDSIVLSKICRQEGITDCMFAHTELEYPEFLGWCLSNLPEGCEVINTRQDLDWLARHQEMIFPKGKELNAWYSGVQRTGFTKYFFDHQLDMIMVGWPHEMTLAYIHYHGLQLPPIYGWKNGFRCGTHPWPSRMYMEDLHQGYSEVWEIDPDISRGAAEKIDSARAFLEEVTSK